MAVPTKSMATLQTPIFRRSKYGSACNTSWKKLFSHCLGHRLRKPQFEHLSNELYIEQPIPPHEIVDILLNCQDGSSPVADPLLSIYLESLFLTQKINAAHLLDGLYIDSRYCIQPSNAPEETLQRRKSRQMTNDMGSRIFVILLRHFVSGKLPTTPEEARQVLKCLSKWMDAVAAFHTSMLQMMQVFDSDGLADCDALGSLVIAVLENVRMIGIIDHAASKAVRRGLAEALSQFIPCWTQCSTPTSAQNINRLMMALQSRTVLEERVQEPSNDAEIDAVAALQVDNISDIAIVHSRPSVFIFLSTLVREQHMLQSCTNRHSSLLDLSQTISS
jgi:hypothetical protein